MRDDEIQAAIEEGERAYRDHLRRPRGDMMLPGDHDPTYWIARAVERTARAQVWREAAEVCEGFDVCDPQHIAREFRARAEKEQG